MARPLSRAIRAAAGVHGGHNRPPAPVAFAAQAESVIPALAIGVQWQNRDLSAAPFFFRVGHGMIGPRGTA